MNYDHYCIVELFTATYEVAKMSIRELYCVYCLVEGWTVLKIEEYDASTAHKTDDGC